MFVFGSDFWVHTEINNVVHRQDLHLSDRRPFCHHVQAAACRRMQLKKYSELEPCQWLLLCFCCAFSDRLGCCLSFSDHLFFHFLLYEEEPLCHEAKPSKLSSSCELLNSLETTSPEAVLTLCCAIAFMVNGATLVELLLSCKTEVLIRTFF